jgi:4-hydroxy-tetrahydrodipicolinate reductase
MMSAVRVAIHGAAGRMGQRLVALGTENDGMSIVAALESANHPLLGQDAGTVAGCAPLGITLTATLDVEADVLIDFSTPEGTLNVIEVCLARRIPLVLATTGFDATQQQRIEAAAETIPLLWAPNMSLAVNLLMKLSSITGRALKDHASGVDVEIIERHHRYKEDAPSGTALMFGKLIAEELGQTIDRHGREGRTGIRPRDEIGYHALRTGDNPGEHTVVFGMLGETIELVVKATNRDCYAQGALSAARFLAGKPSGRYSMNDVLGF